MHHILAYSASNPLGGVEIDTAAITDPSITTRNNHFILTEAYQLIGAAGVGPFLTDARLSSPTIDAIAPARIYPAVASTVAQATQPMMDLRDYPMVLPQNEEIKALLSNNSAAADQDSLFLLIAPQTWNRNLPRGVRRQLIKTSQSVTGVLYGWSADTGLTFTDASPRGGWYYLVGAWAFGTSLLAFRFNFPRMPLIHGRKLFPGGIALASYSGLQVPKLCDEIGVWGYFHTFEPPLLAGFSTVAGAQTIQVLLDVVYVGESEPPIMGA